MKSRHAAALGLVVWYLIIPPASGIHRRGHYANPSAPLAKWYFYSGWKEPYIDRAHAKEFDSEATCEALKEKYYPAHPPPLSLIQGAEIRDRVEKSREFSSYATCVSSDDPRFKEK